MICNRAKPDRKGGPSLQPLEIPEYTWEIVEIDYVTDLPKRGLYGHIPGFIMGFHLTKMAHFVPCHKVITVEKSAD